MSGLLVLVVEDEQLVRMILAESLRADGFKVLEAENADEALVLLEGNRDIFAVITDVRMPGSMNGIGLARQIESRWPEVRVYLTSAYVEPRNGEMPRSASFIPKPYHPERFIELLKANLD
jgi:two-component system, response regulator PdtaR